MIKEIKIKKNVVVINKNHDRGYGTDKGIMIIEEDNGKQHILDLDSCTDISDSDYLELFDTKKTRETTLFKNIIYDTELLDRLAKATSLNNRKCFQKGE